MHQLDGSGSLLADSTRCSRGIKTSEDTRLRFSLTTAECFSFSDPNSEDKETEGRSTVKDNHEWVWRDRGASESPDDHVLDELSQESIRKKYTSTEKKEI